MIVRLAVCTVVLLALARPAAAEAISLTPDAAIERGLAALVKMQQPNGAIGEGAGMTALCGMAFLAGGHTPTRGRYHEASGKALRYVIAEQDPNSGYLGQGMGNMYAHG